jgi:hypothetical protein
VDIQGIGGLFGLPFKQVYDYLKGVKETREVEKQLSRVLQSLSVYKAAMKASEESGTAFMANYNHLKVPISAKDARNLLTGYIKNTNDLADILSSIGMFANECHDLLSISFAGFMEKVKVRKPIVHDLLTFFGNNYNPKSGVIDLTKLPILVRIYSPEMGFKESKQLSQEVAQGKEMTRKAIDKTKEILDQPSLPRIVDRQLIRDLEAALRRLAKNLKTLHTNKLVEKELWGNAPTWFTEVMDISEQVQKSFPILSKRTVLRYNRYRFPQLRNRAWIKTRRGFSPP